MAGRLRAIVLGILALSLAAPVAAAAATEDGGADAAQALAERFSPITMVREQRDPPCDTEEEQYEPTSVETVLGNPLVKLTRYVEGEGLETIKAAPTAADIAGLPDGYYLDLRGKALGDTCVYARDFEKLKEEGKAPVTAYAHIAREAGHPGFALQYWFFWYFNQFNDLHEGDWEGMQITFGSETPAQALASGEEPREIILFQHAGGERAEWNDAKVQKDGVQPIVYPAAGSHATFYDSAVYVENGRKGSGVGCDNTSEPVRELRPEPVLLPPEASTAGPFKWLSYQGRWGEREKGFNNGPTGPATKTQWTEPFSWMAEQRTTSPRLPGGSIVGPQVTYVFCGTIEIVTDLINLEAKSRPAAIGVLAGIAILVALFIGLNRWGPVDIGHLRARRAFGQLLRTAFRFYRHHWKTLGLIGLTAFPIVGGLTFLAQAIGTGNGLDEAAGRGGFNLAAGDLLEGFIHPLAEALIAAIAVVFVRNLVESGEASGFRACWRGTRQRFWRVVGADLLAKIGVILLTLTVIGIPFAIWKYVSWTFVQQEVLFTDKSFREAFRGSSKLVRGRWWHTVWVAGFLGVIAVVAGPVLTLGLIFTALPLTWINLLGSLIFALMIPYAGVGRTLLYFDLQVRASEEPEPSPGPLRRGWRRLRDRLRRPDGATPQPAGGVE
ncbi:MAG: hypothetical protein R2725_05380 [Solirubrobacterales bacterium]